MKAAAAGRTEVLTVLLDKGALIDTQDKVLAEPYRTVTAFIVYCSVLCCN